MSASRYYYYYLPLLAVRTHVISRIPTPYYSFSPWHCRENLSGDSDISTITGVAPQYCGGPARVGPIIPALSTKPPASFLLLKRAKSFSDGQQRIVPIDGLTDLGSGSS